MNMPALLAILLAIAAWLLMGLMGLNLLSGPMEERTCHTACVQAYFYSALAATVLGFILSLLSLRKDSLRGLGITALLLTLILLGIFTVLYVAGNFF